MAEIPGFRPPECASCLASIHASMLDAPAFSRVCRRLAAPPISAPARATRGIAAAVSDESSIDVGHR
jgi:hypothetical protein